MKKFEVYKFVDSSNCAYLVNDFNDIDAACDCAYEEEKKGAFATCLYDTSERKWFGYHKKGTAYILSK